MEKYKVLALYGKGGAGKDTILQWIVSNCYYVHEIISCTTRPPRSGEVNGKNYFFLTEEEFLQKIANKEMLETTCFNNWMYGTPLQGLKKDKINIGVFNPRGVSFLWRNEKIDVLPVEIYAHDIVRLQRMLDRDKKVDCKEVCRRFLADEQDFDKKPDFYNVIYNNSDDKQDFSTLFNLTEIRDWVVKGLKELNI